MARKKTITRDQILDAAYTVVSTEGFSRFTARNIAAKMNCSTQPIYLEFQNMEDLKMALIKKVHEHLANDIFPVVHTGNKVNDLVLNYVGFATKERRLYRAMYLEEYGGGQEMQEFSSNYYKSLIQAEPRFKDLSEEQIDSLHMGTWIVATGIAALMSSGIIQPTEEKIVRLVEETMDSILARKEPIQIS
ncbi:TetR/AcrR family transcriptional regulator [Enterococcus asini]|uniref:TetR/AcrR family transcriptional regulator n=1 Tax=Enterococcus asini TaxID=57732 RepID=UPI001386A1F6|nr:TetR/AcrR family transcriptional regulator [Enterococcus asini]MCD5028279.1 TetR/AcrR family transcriptional regulator [Enterococcus asini]MDT2743862.1 TetR/AcrR family transcriptional regulator [Enterococcus asini]MDT2762850.1 TetR/AcrR family transcriptional regulator [Enterococcus asini]MDT2784563.1 TetR/AcrR family transcriptional regulator [Enterococcus asini]